MRQLSINFACVLLCALFSLPLLADSKDESLRPLDSPVAAADKPAADGSAIEAQLEKKYRTELETRLAEERASYEGSLQSLWYANIGVWGCLFGFIIMQAVSAKKRSAELARLKAQREG